MIGADTRAVCRPTNEKPWITKGTRIRYRVFRAQPIGTWSLAGVQSKLTGSFVEEEGVVTHVRGDHPTHPTEVRLWVRLDDGTERSHIKVHNVIAIIPASD